MRAPVLTGWVIVWVVSLACVASGQTEPGMGEDDSIAERARVHFLQGVALFEEGAHEAALAEFRTSYDLRPLPIVLYNIGAVQRALRRYADAVDTLEEYLSLTEDTDEPSERREAVNRILGQIEAVLGEVEISTSPEGVDVFIDDELNGRTPLSGPLRLEAGEHQLELRLDGYRTHREILDVRSQTTQNHLFEMELIERTPWYRQWWLWTTVGVVVAGAILATVLSLTLEIEEAEFGQIQIVTEGQ